MKDLFELSPQEQIEVLKDLHFTKNMSVIEIAELYGTYNNKIRRLATKLKLKLRDKSEAQSLALKQGRTQHPTKGKARPTDVKIAIGKKTRDYWENLSESELERRSQISKDNWDKMSQTEKDYMFNRATTERLKTAKDGSKLEKAILSKLIEAGYKPVFHQEHSLLNNKLQLDIYIPDIKTAIEIDGVTHFENIWGQDYLSKTKKRDKEKDGLILNAGACIVRIKQTKDYSLTLVEELSDKLLEILGQIKKEYPPLGQRKFSI